MSKDSRLAPLPEKIPDSRLVGSARHYSVKCFQQQIVNNFIYEDISVLVCSNNMICYNLR